MKPTEAAALLTIAASFDNRKPDADQAKAWAMALDGLGFEDCRDVVVEHYRKSREWLMPADVFAGVRRIRYERIERFGYITPPPELDFAEEQAYTQAIRTRVADGELTREQYDADLRAQGLAGDRKHPELERVFRQVDEETTDA